MDLRQSPQYANYLKLIGWVVEKADGNYIYIRKIPLTPFSVIKVQRPKKILFKKIDLLAKKYRAIAIYLEPDMNESRIMNHESRKRGYRLSKSPFLPTRSVQIDLSLPEEKILTQMRKDARYEIRKAEKEVIRLIKVKNLAKFHQVWKKSVTWNRWTPSLKALQLLKKAFDERVFFLIATTPGYDESYHRSEVIAGTLILATNDIAYYYYAFSSKEGREKFAQYLLVWEAIKLTKKRGCQIFDFEGIYDNRFPQKSWKGFSHFKKSFGGKEVEYLGSFVKYRLPF